MNLATALKKPRTVPELVKLTKLSRGGVLAGLKRLKAKKTGSKKNDRGPKSTLYQLRIKVPTPRATFPTPAQTEQATLTAANTDGSPLETFDDSIAAAIADTEDKPTELPPPAL
jgi:hypothetical protein